MAISRLIGGTVTKLTSCDKTDEGDPLNEMRPAWSSSPISWSETSATASCSKGVVEIARAALLLNRSSSVAAQRKAWVSSKYFRRGITMKASNLHPGGLASSDRHGTQSCPLRRQAGTCA